MDMNSNIDNFTHINKGFTGTWVEFIRIKFTRYPQDLPEIILIIPLICTIGAFLNLHLKDFPIPLPVILFLMGCSFEILSFTSDKVQKYSDAIQWMDENLYFDLFTPVIVFNVAFDMDVYMLHKLFWQIVLITIPGFFINYILILWYLASVDKLNLKTISWLLFAVILVSSDPMLTVAAIRDLGFSRGLINLINGESLMTSTMSFVMFKSIVDINSNQKYMNHSLAHTIMDQIMSYCGASFLVGIFSSKLIQLWMSTVFGDDINHISLSFSILYFIFFICKQVGMSGIVTLATMGLFLNSISFKPGVEALLLEFWSCLSFVAFLMVFTFIGLLIPAHTYLYISFSDIYYSLNIYFTLIVLRLLVLLFLSPLLSRLADGFSWRWAFIMVWSEMKGVPNINMALLFAYSDLPFGSEREKSQILFHGVLVCIITLIINKIVLPMVVSKLGLHDVTSTKYKSLYYTFQHFQEITKSAASALKFDKDLANADWSMVETAIIFQNPYALSQGETTEHQKVNCPKCNKEIDETLNIEAMELANRRLLSAQIIAAMRKEYYLQTWNLTELAITLVGILELILFETQVISETFNLDPLEAFFRSIQLLRILRVLKLITPKLLQFLDKRMSHQLSYRYAILKGYVQGEADIMTIIDQIASSKQVKQMLLRRITRNTVHAMKELGYLEYDHPEIAVTMKTKEEINVMLSLAREIVRVFRLKGILHKIEASEINKLITAKKRDLLDFQPVIKPLTIGQALYHIPWLDKNKDYITFIQERAKFVTFDCGNDIFEEGDEPSGIYVIISGMIKLQKSKPVLVTDEMLSESEEKEHQITFTDYVISGEIIGELNCLTNQPMKYSATCKTVVEICFISKNHLYEAFEKCCPHIEYKMWLKLGLSITAKKIREHLSYEDWNYKMQLKLCNVYIRDIPKNTKSDIYDETVIYVILIHGAVEDCHLRKVYTAPFLIPITCHQIQGTEDFTKVMIVQTPIDVKKFRWSTRKYLSSRQISSPAASLSLNTVYEEGLRYQTPTEERPEEMLKSIKEEVNTDEDT
ncbi:solute carrier family 9 member C1 [Phyllostomus discolor]|uniref:Solute carrier family 9 member C1 n=1 Tax=Phyllostomus discolor TaxID=89673 RepID=A0A834B1X2_9CHIR|nr:solute carrier family 9 member C1 [Phyllostomus discolor]